MELWMKYALVAAVFIAVRDVFASKIARKYNYIDYVIHANIFVFIITMLYVVFTKRKIKIIDDYNDLFLIFLRLFIVFIIVEPCIFNSFKNSDNPSKSVSIINLNILILLIFSVLFLKQKISFKQFLGVIIIFIGLFYLR
uniref:EamA domain-containing protein n=1 Tax=viral metagenome TaxID=1070528 RepID=A0A6C0C861_9ZZZZ